MSLGSNSLIAAIQQEVRLGFAGYPRRVTLDIEDDHIITVDVFAVPSDKKASIEDDVYELCDLLLAGTGYIAGVTVRDVERTRLYYPEFLPPSPPVALSQLMNQLELLTWEESPAPLYNLCASEEYSQIPDAIFARAA